MASAFKYEACFATLGFQNTIVFQKRKLADDHFLFFFCLHAKHVHCPFDLSTSLMRLHLAHLFMDSFIIANTSVAHSSG